MNPINAAKKAILFSLVIFSIIILFPSGYLLAADPPYSNVLKLDGSSAYAGTPDQSELQVGSGTFVYELWFKINTLPSTDGDKKFLFSKRNSLSLFIENDSGVIKLSSNLFDVSYIRPGSATSISTGTWYHAALRRVGDTLATFLDGTPVATYTGSAGFPVPAGDDLLVGSDTQDGITRTYFPGTIDDLRLRKGGDYSTITKPAAAFLCPDNSDTYALWHFNEAAGASAFFDEDCLIPVDHMKNNLSGLGGAVTLITLDFFTATPSDGKITLNWKTVTEQNNAGFNILRSESISSGYSKINDTLIPGKGDTVTGSSYSFVDATAKPGTLYFYKLEDVDLNGTSTTSNPVAASFGEVTIISPVNGMMCKKNNPSMIFSWESNGLSKCQLQLSTNPDFSNGDNTLIVSNSKKVGKNKKSIKLGGKSLKWLNAKGKGNTIYWRIVGEKSGGKKSLSEVRTLSLK